MTRPVALVTGAGRGIGLAIATSLAEAGFDIAINEKSGSDQLDERITALRRLGIRAVPIVGDIADLSIHDSLLDSAEQALGPLTVLVNNAGVSAMDRGDLIDVTPESYDRCQSVNARGAFFLTQRFARRLLSRDRSPTLHYCIINITSSNATAASVNRGEYCVSKAAASMTSRLFAIRLGAENIAVYEIQPGVIETDMTAPALDVYRGRIADGLTLSPRVGQPSEIGAIAAVLASGKFAYCTGQAIRVDGGLTVPRF